MARYSKKTRDMILNIINEEMAEIRDMKPDKEENYTSYNVRKQHYYAEAKAIKARIFMELD